MMRLPGDNEENAFSHTILYATSRALYGNKFSIFDSNLLAGKLMFVITKRHGKLPLLNTRTPIFDENETLKW